MLVLILILTVSIVSPNVNTASLQVSTARFSDNDVYAFMVESPNGSNLLQQDLEKIHEDDWEAMDLKWQLSLLSMRAKRYYQRTGKKIFINANDTAGYDKSKNEVLFSEEVAVLKRELRLQKSRINVLKSESEKVKQEKEGIEFKIEKFDKASKGIDKLLGSQISNKDDSKENSDDSLEKEQVSEDTIKKSVRYAEMYRSQSPIGNQRNWNGQKSNQLGSNFVMYNKACFIFGSFDHVQAQCKYHQRERMVYGNNYHMVNYNYTTNRTHPNSQRNMVPRAVLMKSGPKSFNTARTINTAHPKSIVFSATSLLHFSKLAQSTIRRPYQSKTVLSNKRFTQTNNTAKAKAVNTARPKAVNTAWPHSAVVNVVRVNQANVVKTLAYWVWRPTKPDIGGGAHGGKIYGKGTLKTDSLDFEDVYFVNKLKFNLFSVSHMCDKKNYVLFTDTECLVLSPNFKLPDESQILLKIPRKDNMYSFDMKNIVPKESLTCLVAKATLDESMLWHRRLGHINFKNINKLVKDNLVRGLPTKCFENDQTCVACLKGKQHRASYTISNEFAGTQEEFNAGTSIQKEEISQDCIVMPIWKDASYFDSPSKMWAVMLNQNFLLLSSDPDSPKDMFTMGASHTLEATHVEFFSDEDEPKVDLGNILNSYTVPTTPNTRIHKDHPIKNVIWGILNLKHLCILYMETIKKEVYVTQPPGLKILPIRQVLQGGQWQLYGVASSTRAWYETLANYLLGNGFKRGKINQTLFIKKKKEDILLVQIKLQMSLWERTLLLLRIIEVDLEKPLVKDGDADDVDVHLYRSMIGSLMYLTTSRPDIMFACKKQTMVATSKTEAEYMVAASCCGQVLWIQNQLLDYGIFLQRFDAGRHVKRGWDTKIPQSSGPPIKVGDEAVHKELSDRIERAATTASSLEAEQDSGNINRTQSMATLIESNP
ncbi:ribonuclease H-like domain-containing protein [Tanacetum coccineum]